MLPGVLDMIPSAKVSVVGMRRDETTLQPVAYYEKLSGREFLRIGLCAAVFILLAKWGAPKTNIPALNSAAQRL